MGLHRSADAHVGAQVLAVRVEHVQLAGFGAKQHHLLAEIMNALNLAGGQVRGKPDDEPSGRKSVRRKADAARPEFSFGRIYGGVRNRVRHYPLRSRAAESRTAALTITALNSRRAWTTQSIFTILSIERQRGSLAAVVSGQLTAPSAVLASE